MEYGPQGPLYQERTLVSRVWGGDAARFISTLLSLEKRLLPAFEG